MTTASIRIATLRGPSAIEMIRMIDDARKCGSPDIEVFDEPMQVVCALAAGKPDFAVLPAAAAAVLQAKGIDYRKVATVIRGGLYLCGRDCTIKGIGDLKGRTINVMAGATPPEVMLRKLISTEGLEPGKDVFFDSTFPTHKALAEAAANGLTELCIMSEPFVSQAVREKGNLHILLDLALEWKRKEGSSPSVAALFCKGQVADEHPETVNEITCELKRSCEWVKANPDKAAALVCKAGIFRNAAAIADSIPRSGFDVVV